PHDEPRARIPRVVLPEGEVSARRERAMHVAERSRALRGLDVMEDAVAIHELELSCRLEVARGPELQTRVGVHASRDVEALARGVDADDRSRVELSEKFGGGAA